jgi:hypothetical protein
MYSFLMMTAAGLRYLSIALLLGVASGECVAGDGGADGEVVAKPAAPGSALAPTADAPQDSAEEQADEVGSTATEPLCETLAREAIAHDLPVEFFASLIWKESRLDPEALSPRGARGIAQFMPKTATWRGLLDPYEPKQALSESASFLRDLKSQFGNWGLAAAAYNAGPTRLRHWLNGSGILPSETRNYVATITGLTIEEWTRSLPADFVDFTARETNPCSTIPVNIAEVVPPVPLRRPSAVELPTTAPWGLQLVGDSSETRALAAYRNLQKKHAFILGDRVPLILRTQGGRGPIRWVRIRVAEGTRAQAMQLCAKLKADGGSCLVVRN